MPAPSPRLDTQEYVECCDNPIKIEYNQPISNKTTSRIYGLQKNKIYYIRIAGKNYAGTGDKSDPIMVKYHLVEPLPECLQEQIIPVDTNPDPRIYTKEKTIAFTEYCDNPVQIDYNTPISNKREMRIYGLEKNKTYFIVLLFIVGGCIYDVNLLS